MASTQPASSKVLTSPEHSSPTLLSVARLWTGFANTESLLTFLCTAGVMFTFCALKLRDLDYQYWLDNNPFHQFPYTEGTAAFMMKMHLRAVIPIGLLLPIQFIPSLRRTYPTLHRLIGRLLLLLLFAANITALGVAPRTQGGTIGTRIGIFSLVPILSYTSYKAWSSIMQLRIDRHREWMIRTWSYAGLILTLRILIISFAIGAQVLNPAGFKGILSCQELIFLYESQGNKPPIEMYPACVNISPEAQLVYVVVTAGTDDKRPEEVAVMISLCFTVAAWAAFVIHSLGAEWYLTMTRQESERLKGVSNKLRKARGREY